MTDEDAFYAAIAARPDDGLTRRVFADWLEERAGTESCENCGGGGSLCDPTTAGASYPCLTCSGTGRVPDRTARLAAGYRALGEFGLRPSSGSWFLAHPSHRNKTGDLPRDWYVAVEGYLPLPAFNHKLTGQPPLKAFPKDRLAEDAAALAWSALTDVEREACVRELTGIPAYT